MSTVLFVLQGKDDKSSKLIPSYFSIPLSYPSFVHTLKEVTDGIHEVTIKIYDVPLT
jgi:hypothetical protein